MNSQVKKCWATLGSIVLEGSWQLKGDHPSSLLSPGDTHVEKGQPRT